MVSDTRHHRELRCVEHLSNVHSIPMPRELPKKRYYGSSQQSTMSLISEEYRSNPRGVAGDDDNHGIAREGLAYDKSGAGKVGAFVDRGLSEGRRNQHQHVAAQPFTVIADRIGFSLIL
jgi:hypothetical protein